MTETGFFGLENQPQTWKGALAASPIMFLDLTVRRGRSLTANLVTLILSLPLGYLQHAPVGGTGGSTLVNCGWGWHKACLLLSHLCLHHA